GAAQVSGGVLEVRDGDRVGRTPGAPGQGDDVAAAVVSVLGQMAVTDMGVHRDRSRDVAEDVADSPGAAAGPPPAALSVRPRRPGGIFTRQVSGMTVIEKSSETWPLGS